MSKVTVTAYIVLEDNGDGSSSPNYFSSEAEAQKFIDNYKSYGNAYPDEVHAEEFEIVDGFTLKPLYGGFDDV